MLLGGHGVSTSQQEVTSEMKSLLYYVFLSFQVCFSIYKRCKYETNTQSAPQYSLYQWIVAEFHFVCSETLIISPLPLGPGCHIHHNHLQSIVAFLRQFSMKMSVFTSFSTTSTSKTSKMFKVVMVIQNLGN